MWNKHEPGDYATIGLCWNQAVRSDAPWEYIRPAEAAIFRLSTAVDGPPIESDDDDDESEDDEDDDEEEEDEPEREETGEPPLHV
jgi:hypothetical protein